MLKLWQVRVIAFVFPELVSFRVVIRYAEILVLFCSVLLGIIFTTLLSNKVEILEVISFRASSVKVVDETGWLTGARLADEALLSLLVVLGLHVVRPWLVGESDCALGVTQRKNRYLRILNRRVGILFEMSRTLFLALVILQLLLRHAVPSTYQIFWLSH
jgi:hypothetical protein